MSTTIPYLDHLRHDLVTGIGDVRRRRTRRVTTALVAAVVLAALPVTLAGRPPARALAVTRTAEVIELRIADASASAAAMTRELRAAGIEGEVQVVPVEPALVGKWAAVAEKAGLDGPGQETVRLDRIEYSPELVRIPVAQVRDSSGSFLFLAGRAPRDGEAPAIRGGRVPRELLR